MCALSGWKETFRDVGHFGYSRFEVKVRIFCVVLQGIASPTDLVAEYHSLGIEKRCPEVEVQGSVRLTAEALRAQRRRINYFAQAAGVAGESRSLTRLSPPRVLSKKRLPSC